MGDDERRRQPLFRVECGIDRLLQFLAVDLHRQGTIRHPIAHRPGKGLGGRERGADIDGIEEDILLPHRQGDATMVAVQLCGPNRAVRQRQVDAPAVLIDLAPRDMAAVLVRSAEETDVLGREVRVQAGYEDGRAEGLGESGDVVRERIARRRDVFGVEFRLGGSRQHRRSLILALPRGGKNRDGGERHDAQPGAPRPFSRLPH